MVILAGEAGGAKERQSQLEFTAPSTPLVNNYAN